MSKRIFTPEEQDILRNNPNISSCTDRSITFTTAFKQHAVRAHREGRMPQEIFAAAGLPLSLIGRENPKRRLKQWLAIERKHGIDALLHDGRGKHATGRKRIERLDLEKMTKDEQIEYLKARIAYTDAENDFFAQARGIKRIPFVYRPGNDAR